MFKKNRLIVVALLLVLAFALLPVGQALGRNPEMEATQQFLTMMERYLEISDRWVEMLSSEERAVFLAVEGIVEIYEERGEKAAALDHLGGLLERHKGNQTVRNAVRFKMRDIYRETGQPQKALAELDRIIAENVE